MSQERMTEVWFIRPPESSPEGCVWLLEGGSSEDGMGPGTPLGYTDDRSVALAHWKEIRKNPHSTGRVLEVRPFKPALSGEIP